MENHDKYYGFIIESTSKVMKHNFQRLLKELDAGVTVDQWVILNLLYQNNALSQREIATLSFKDSPTVTRIIDILYNKKLAERKPDADDRRKYRILLTDEGRNKVKRLIPNVREFREIGWKSLTDEDYDDLIRILNKIFTNFSTDKI